MPPPMTKIALQISTAVTWRAAWYVPSKQSVRGFLQVVRETLTCDDGPYDTRFQWSRKYTQACDLGSPLANSQASRRQVLAILEESSLFIRQAYRRDPQ